MRKKKKNLRKHITDKKVEGCIWTFNSIVVTHLDKSSHALNWDVAIHDQNRRLLYLLAECLNLIIVIYISV